MSKYYLLGVGSNVRLLSALVSFLMLPFDFNACKSVNRITKVYALTGHLRPQICTDNIHDFSKNKTTDFKSCFI